MIKSNKNNKKKKGFTLVELIAVIAIIGILAAILVPTISGYITKAKKTKVVEQARTFVMAVESVASEPGVTLPAGNKGTWVGTSLDGIAEYKESMGGKTTAEALPKIGAMTYDEAVRVAAGKTLTITDNGNFSSVAS